jgi:primosomal protein N' (replication factor Y) (superfamily II helicase)
MQYEQFLHGQKKVYLVDMKEDKTTAMFSSLADMTLEKYSAQGKRILIVGGKKGLASWVMCQECGFIPQCARCDVPIAFHRDAGGSTFGICHICKTSYPAVDQCPQCQWYDVKLFGTGLQKIQEFLAGRYPGLSTMCIDAQTVGSLPKITRVRDALRDVQCVIATSLLQTPPVGWTPDVVIIVRADSSLSVPDWKVSEHCYTMLSHCIRAYDCPIIVQAYTVWHHAVRAACAMDDAKFWEEETAFRVAHSYPPHGELAVILYKHEIEATMFTRVNKLYQELLFLAEKRKFAGEIFATPPLIYKIYDKYRYNIVIKGTDVRTFLDEAFVDLKMRERGFKIDWMPEWMVG